MDMSTLYRPFLDLIPKGGRILDAGCGSGRDSLNFQQHGYSVEAFDASLEMCRFASSLIAQPVSQKTFDEVDWVAEFDGVWACASLLHVRRQDIDLAVERLIRSLRQGGVMYVSFKNLDGEWESRGRFFSGYTSDTFPCLLGKHPDLNPITIWTTADLRPNRGDEKWLNALLRKDRAYQQTIVN